MKLRRETALLILFALACLQAIGSSHTGAIAAPAKKAGPRQYIYSRSSTPTDCKSLGVKAVPAYVNFPNGGQKLGIYITSADANSPGLKMGLRPGRVLITVDGVSAQSPSTVDSVLGNHKSGSFDYSYVYLSDGQPQISSGKSSLLTTTAAGTGVVSGNVPSRAAAASKSGTESISSLEGYMVSLVNEDRSKNGGIGSLSDNSQLSDLARRYAEVILENGGTLSHTDRQGHTPQDRAKAAGVNGAIAENLANQGYWDMKKSEKDMVAAAQKQMMNEPPNQQNHRGNILSPVMRSIGIGIARNKSMMIICQEFSN